MNQRMLLEFVGRDGYEKAASRFEKAVGLQQHRFEVRDMLENAVGKNRAICSGRFWNFRAGTTYQLVVSAGFGGAGDFGGVWVDTGIDFVGKQILGKEPIPASNIQHRWKKFLP